MARKMTKTLNKPTKICDEKRTEITKTCQKSVKTNKDEDRNEKYYE